MAQVHAFCLQEVFQEASKSVVDFNGLSILEVSHRHKDFVAVMDEAIALVKQALNVPEGYSVIFFFKEELL